MRQPFSPKSESKSPKLQQPVAGRAVPGRPGISLNNLTTSAKNKVLKDEREFRTACARHAWDAVETASELMRSRVTASNTRLAAASWLSANAFGTPRPMRGEPDEPEDAIAVRIIGGLPD